jgi:CheY-like chemotaxis protein
MREDINGRRVLLVEDEEVSAKVVRKMLGTFGLDVDVARDGVSALELLGTWTYEMVFMDCHLPGIDGFEATRALRASTGWATPNDVAVLALTADRRGADVAPCMAAGMNAHLSKPASLQTLAEAIEHWMPVRAI